MNNKQYESLRNLLIPEAIRYANSVVPQPKIGSSEVVRDTWAEAWNLEFHTKMNELAKKRGLTD